MNWKLTLVGGLVFWLVSNVIGWFVTGPLMHEGLLGEVYRAHSEFWWPALNQEPPDVATLMPHWLLASLIGSLVYAGIYSVVRGSSRGSGWRRGLTVAL